MPLPLTAAPPSPEGGLLLGPARFRLSTDRRALWDGSRQIVLGSRAMSILVALVARAGELVTKEDLVRTVWPETFVEEVNLRVHISALRRALGDDRRDPRYIVNVAGRGYILIAQVTRTGFAPAAPVPRRLENALSPPRPTTLFGAVTAVQHIVDLLSHNRLVTITGAPGAGKTALAVEAARQVQGAFPACIFLLDLSGGPDTATLAETMAATLGNPAKGSACLLLLDGCDRMLDETARAAETMLRRFSGLRILTTSTELLRAEGEVAHRVANLPVSATGTKGDAPAVALFLHRAAQAGWTAAAGDRPVVLSLCKTLDGNPRAIERAAEGVARLGLPDLVRRIETTVVPADAPDGSPSALTTLQALTAWSLDALTQTELCVLRRLSVFAGTFTVDAACAVACDAGLPAQTLIETVQHLLARSLLETSIASTPRQLHLPQPVQSICRIRLALNPAEADAVGIRHAAHVCSRLSELGMGPAGAPASRAGAGAAVALPDLRAALAVAATLDDPSLHADLASLALPLGHALGWADEIRGHAEAALSRLAARDPARSAGLCIALALFDLAHQGAAPEVVARIQQARIFATAAPQARGPVLMAAAWAALHSGDFAAAQGHAVLARRAAWPDDQRSTAFPVLDAVRAAAEHGSGDQRQARDRALQLIRSAPPALAFRSDPHRQDIRIGLRIVAARSHWILGQADQARLAVSEALGYAADEGPLALCQTLGWAACPVLFWCGDDMGAAQHVRRLRAEADRAGLAHWQSWASVFEATIRILAAREGRGNPVHPLPPCDLVQQATMATVAGELHPADALAQGGTLGWCAPELARLQALRTASSGAEHAADIGRYRLHQAHALAARQGALAWQLRAAISLARDTDAATAREGLVLLKDSYERFSEGHQTSDLIVARSILRDRNPMGR